ncbi:sigma 54-interacting transcriptional regulator [Anaerovorax odorimutans]|uniref:Sigma 54-interacting transcriptional regulator n=1 Tax=Anaerovorax odorimutans TaxID=109327 RepID=A0ABT1RRS4_9FIRM|nr:sigma 54-interacting transcriptional regulator [Anaerovorax odorimutans]MCQ4637861.1 sigma 54-interacting transcriptional regulator [Anaerovorax odorimutans]
MEGYERENRKLLICISDPTILEFLTDAIRTYFEDVLDIISIRPSKLFDLDFEPTAAIVSHRTVSIVKERFPDTTLILQKRDLSGQALEKVVSLPDRSNVLVVNQHMDAANETINSFIELGINHINMTAYAPGNNIDTSHINAVIYTGVFEDCPKLDCPYIDIGLRKISLYTIIDIIRAFDLPSEYTKAYYNNSIQLFTASCYQIHNTLEQANTLKNNFEKICDINNNITFVINENNEIVLFNETAKKYFEIKNSQDIIGADYKEVFSSLPELLSCISADIPLTDALITIENQKLLLSSFEMDVDKSQNKAFTLLPLSTLKKREGMVRKKLRATGFTAKYTFDDILGSSTLIKQNKKLANVYAKTEFPVLITGESGTGKELFAQAIHNISSRRESNFVAINFAALPETLAESELFGYMEGAFTGASKSGKAGMFELAHQGTIFLDEIGDASLPVQAKLLRVLEEKEVVRVGGTDVIPVDVRIICATNKNLKAAISEGSFREDLYYRIKVLHLRLQPLRERPEDIMETISHLLVGEQAHALANLPNIRNTLIHYDWPGNARELRTVAEYINMLSSLSDREEALDMLNVYIENNLCADSCATAESFRRELKPENNLSPEPADQSTADYISPDLIVVLEAIFDLQNQGVTAGRNSICKTPGAKKMQLTESKIKNRLKKLEAMGCITVGKTKQGALLTDKGYHLIRQHGLNIK